MQGHSTDIHVYVLRGASPTPAPHSALCRKKEASPEQAQFPAPGFPDKPIRQFLWRQLCQQENAVVHPAGAAHLCSAAGLAENPPLLGCASSPLEAPAYKAGLTNFVALTSP